MFPNNNHVRFPSNPEPDAVTHPSMRVTRLFGQGLLRGAANETTKHRREDTTSHRAVLCFEEKGVGAHCLWIKLDTTTTAISNVT